MTLLYILVVIQAMLTIAFLIVTWQHLGHTALADAVRLRNVEMVTILIGYKANPNIVSLSHCVGERGLS